MISTASQKTVGSAPKYAERKLPALATAPPAISELGMPVIPYSFMRSVSMPENLSRTGWRVKCFSPMSHVFGQSSITV